MPTTKDTLFIRIASERQLLTKEQIAECREIQKTLRQVREKKSLLVIAVNKRYVSKVQAAEIEELLERDGLPKKLGEFEIISKIGKGGMGAVYKARQASMDRDVALKVLPVDLSEDESLISRFYREAKSVGRLNHPNVVIGIAAGEAEGHRYFAMEYVEGEDLSSVLAKRGKSGKGRLEVKEAVDVILQVSRGLAAAHEQNIIHRDIKPANVLMTKDGTAKLADLGLAKRLNVEDMSFVTQTGQMMGTPYYMSPEQITDPKSVDQRSDIYSLGAMFYHVLTGEVPYSGKSVYEVIQKHQTAPVPWPDEKNPEIPMVVCEILQKMLAKSPEDRYQSAGEVTQELEAFIEADSAAEVQPGGVSGKQAYVIPEEEIAALEGSLKGAKKPSGEKLAHATKKAEVSVAAQDFEEHGMAKVKLSKKAVIGLASGLMALLTMVIFVAMALVHEPEDQRDSAKVVKDTKVRQTRQPKDGKKREARSTPPRTVESGSKSAKDLFDGAAVFEEGKTEEQEAKNADADAENDAESLEQKAAEAYAKAKTEAERYVEANEYSRAIEIYKGIAASSGIKEYEDDANKMIASLEAMLKEGESCEELAYKIDSLFADEKYDEAQKACNDAISKLANETEKRLLIAYRDQIGRIEKFWEAVAKGMKGEVGSKDDKLLLKGGTIAGELKTIEGDQIVLMISGGRKLNFPLKELRAKEALRLARKGLEDASIEKPLVLAAFLQEEGIALAQNALKAKTVKPSLFSRSEERFDQALDELNSVGQRGAPTEIYMKSIEAAKKRQAKTKLEEREIYSKLRALFPKGSIPKPKPASKIDKATGLPLEVISEKDGAEMVLVPAGEFKMGSNDGKDNEKPVHKVYLDTFYIDKYEVTNAQYRKFVNATGHPKPRLWDNPAFNAPKQPVVGVSWDDAVAYAEWAGRRLPTEAEWEKAARGTDGRRYPWGDDEPDETKANFDRNVGKPTDVGSYPQGVSPYGCYDMAGNVWECCADWFGADYYTESARENPKGPDSGDFRVLRGGGWDYDPLSSRASLRFYNDPADGHNDDGFRCAGLVTP